MITAHRSQNEIPRRRVIEIRVEAAPARHRAARAERQARDRATTTSSCRLPIRGTIRSLPSAVAAASSKTPTATLFLDFAAGIAVCSTGHCHPKVVAAIQKQAADTDPHVRHRFLLPSTCRNLPNDWSPPCRAPSQDKVFFSNSGTEAVEGAIKLARYATRATSSSRSTAPSMDARWAAFPDCLEKHATQGFRRAAGRRRAHSLSRMPIAARSATRRETCGARNSSNCWKQQIFKRLFDPEEVAAIIVEPIQGEGGYIPAPAFFLQELQRMCRQHGIVLILDEVQSGMGRTGKWWAYDHAGIEPDICADRQRASPAACPSAPFIAKRKHHAVEARLARNHFRRQSRLHRRGSGHHGPDRRRLSCANARQASATTSSARLADWPKSKFKIVGDVRGKGLMIGIEIVRDQKTKEKGAALRDKSSTMLSTVACLHLGAGENSIRCPPADHRPGTSRLRPRHHGKMPPGSRSQSQSISL